MRLITALCFLLLSTATASADLIDFTLADPFQQGHLQPGATFTHLGYTFTLTARPEGARLTWNPGFGITYECQLLDEFDEIDYPEVLWVEFARPEYLESFTVSNLYGDELWGLNAERGQYSTDGGITWISFSGTESGEKTIAVNREVESIRFTVHKRDMLLDEYTLKALNMTRVPEGSAAGLLAVAGAALLGLRRRK